MAYFDVNEVQRAAEGRWIEVLRHLLPEDFHGALDRPGKAIRCPVHGGNGKKFRFFRDVASTGGAICSCCESMKGGLAVLQWATGASWKEALDQVAGVLGVPPQDSDDREVGPAPVAAPATTSAPAERDYLSLDSFKEASLAAVCRKAGIPRHFLGREIPLPPKGGDALGPYNAKAAEKAAEAWGAEMDEEGQVLSCSSLAESEFGAGPLRDYMANRLGGRRVLLDPEVVRLQPRLEYVDDDDNVSHWPGMVALISGPEGDIVGVHRTYLTREGLKAPVDSPKKALTRQSGAMTGGAIRLWEPEGADTLYVTEGIETAWAVQAATPGAAVWAAINAGNMERLVVPSRFTRVVVMADHDQHWRWDNRRQQEVPHARGQLAGARLALRLGWAGFKVDLRVPPAQPHVELDWLDVFQLNNAVKRG